MNRDYLKIHLQKLTLSAMFLAIGLVLPFLTGQIPVIGNLLLPMHLPVFLCGLICGWQYGGAVGFICPLLRYALFHMPPMPQGIGMAFELATYGLIVGLVYGLSKWKCVYSLYRSMIIAMIGGRIVWGVARTIMVGAANVPFGWEAFITSGFVVGIPGIIIQLVLIPVIMIALDKAKLVPFSKAHPKHSKEQA